MIKRAVLFSTANGAAEALGPHLNTLRNRMKKLGIPTRACRSKSRT